MREIVKQRFKLQVAPLGLVQLGERRIKKTEENPFDCNSYKIIGAIFSLVAILDESQIEKVACAMPIESPTSLTAHWLVCSADRYRMLFFQQHW